GSVVGSGRRPGWTGRELTAPSSASYRQGSAREAGAVEGGRPASDEQRFGQLGPLKHLRPRRTWGNARAWTGIDGVGGVGSWKPAWSTSRPLQRDEPQHRLLRVRLGRVPLLVVGAAAAC